MKSINKLENEPNYYAVYSLSMVNHLVRSGFDIVKVSDNERDSKYKKFLFYDNFKLRESMSSYKRREV